MRPFSVAVAAAIIGISSVTAVPVSPTEIQRTITNSQLAINGIINSILSDDRSSAQYNYYTANTYITSLGYTLAPTLGSCNDNNSPTYNQTSAKSQIITVGSLESIQCRLAYLSNSLLFNDTASALSAWQFSMAYLDTTYDYIFSNEHIDDQASTSANKTANVFGLVETVQTSLNLVLLDLERGDPLSARYDWNIAYNMISNDLVPSVPCELSGTTKVDPCVSGSIASYDDAVKCVQSAQKALTKMAGNVLSKKNASDSCAAAGRDLALVQSYVVQ